MRQIRVEIVGVGADFDLLRAGRRNELVRRHLDAARHHMQQATQSVELARRAAVQMAPSLDIAASCEDDGFDTETNTEAATR